MGPSGGIGGAFEELALLLARKGASVDVILVGSGLDSQSRLDAVGRYLRLGVTLKFLDVRKYAWAGDAPEARSYAVSRALTEKDANYDVIHFHDYHGIGYFSTRLKRQGLAFQETQLVVQLHGVSEWTLSANEELPTNPNQLKIFHLERGTLAAADHVVSPSAYLIEWLISAGFELPPIEDRHVIKNVCTNVVNSLTQYGAASSDSPAERIEVDEIIMFGRHEYRKGYSLFLEALDRVRDELAEAGILVTFLGKFGRISDQHSGTYFARKAKDWNFPVQFLPNLDRYGAAEYLSSRPNVAVFVPSPYENSPYTVLELLALRKATYASSGGGGGELMAQDDHRTNLFRPTPGSIASVIHELLTFGAHVPNLAESLDETEEAWVSFHDVLVGGRRTRGEQIVPSASEEASTGPRPKVTLGITHYERPIKLLDAILSSVSQSYENLEIVVLDDGSPTKETQDKLDKLETVVRRVGGRLIRAENGYLGAARNRIAAESDADYLCFLDDDDYLASEAIEKLVTAAESTGAALTTCLNVFMPERDRALMISDSESFQRPVSFVPTGGPLSLAPLANVFGAATTLIRRESFVEIEGYTELRGVGHEDYELFVRALQAGHSLDVVPLPLYLYEVDRPSMISSTSSFMNFKRITDAIDPSLNVDMWRSLFETLAGENARENAENRRIWESRQAGYWSYEEPLLDWRTPLDEQARLLEEFSRAYGSGMAAGAFNSLQRQLSAESTPLIKEAAVPHRKRRAANSNRSAKQDDSFDVLLALMSGDEPALNNSIAEYFSGHWSLNEADLTLIDKIVMGSQLTDSGAIALLELIDQFEFPSGDLERIAKVRFRLGRIVGDDQIIKESISIIASVDEDAYLLANSDVATAVQVGSFDSGLHHYLKSGRKEGRGGYRQVRVWLGEDPETLAWLADSLSSRSESRK